MDDIVENTINVKNWLNSHCDEMAILKDLPTKKFIVVGYLDQ